MLDLLKKHGITNVAELVARLGLSDEPKSGDMKHGPETVGEAVKSLLGDTPSPTPSGPDLAPEPSALEGHGGERDASTGAGRAHAGHQIGRSHGDREDAGRGKSTVPGAGQSSPESAGGRPFVSYVAVLSEEEEADPDGLDQSARMVLEAQAIELILAYESQWQRTPLNNPGYDLFEVGEDGKPTLWCEVKAMTRSLHERPVGLSRKQFEFAREHGEAYWLYIVEHADTDSARIVRIQDPAGKARTFTFDHGWLAAAEVDQDQIDSQD